MRKDHIGKEKIFYLISIMVAVSFVIGSLAIGVSYYVSFEQKRLSLVETAQSQARLIESMAKFDAQFSTEDHPEGAYGATLSQVIMAHESDKGFGETGEFTLARLEGDQIVFLFSHRFLDMDTPKPVPFDSDIAEPMRRALKGESGSIEGLDYRGERVLAAYEPVNWADNKIGIVAKIDISEIQRPFAIAGLITGLLAMVILGFGLFMFNRLTRPFAGPDSEISHKKKTDYRWLIAGPAFLSAVILYIDISIPLGVAGGVPYVALFLFSILSPTRFFIVSIGILGTIMTITGFFLSPEGGLLWIALLNRFLAIFAIWITAILTLYHKETEIKVVDSVAKLEKSQEIAHIGSWDWNFATNEIYWSDEIYKILGRQPQEFDPTYEAFLEAIHPDDKELVKQAVNDSISSDKPYSIEHRIVRPDRQERIVHERGVVYRDNHGKPFRMFGTSLDITERKKAEEEFSNIFNLSPEMIWTGALDGVLTNINPATKQILGYEIDEMIGRSFVDFLHPDDVERTKDELTKALGGARDHYIENRYKCKNGDYKSIGWTARSFVDDGRFFAIGRDITERKRVEESLSASEQKFRALTQSASDAIITANSKGEIVTWNSAAEAIFNYGEDEALSQPITILVPERYKKQHCRAFDMASLNGELKNPESTIEIEGVKKNGSEFPMELSLSCWTLGENLFFTSIIRDITTRKLAEEALLESEERYRLIVEGVKIIAWEFDPAENIFTFVSGQAEEILGHQVEQWYEKDFMESHIYHEDRKSTVNFCTKAFEKGEDHEFEYRMVSAKGRVVWLRDIVQIVKENGKPISTRGIMIDITDRKKAEQELFKYRDHLEELIDNRTAEIKLIQKIAVAANEALTVDEAMLTCLNQVCSYTGWEIGHVYTPEAEGVCIPTDLWHMKNPERFNSFLKTTMDTTFPSGVGLPGRVTKSGQPAWIKDVTKDDNFPRTVVAKELGIKAGFAFPVKERENVVAVLEFFTTISVEPDQMLLDTVKNLASQIGRLTERKRTERELLLKNYAIDTSMDAMMMANLDYEITYVNQKMYELWGYDEKELLGRDTSFLRAEEHLKGTIQKIVLEKGESEGEFLARRKDGSTFITYYSSSMVSDKNGNVVSNITSFVDMTERIRNEEAVRKSEERFRSIFNNSNDAIFIVEPEEDKIIEVNPNACGMLGYSREELLSAPMSSIHPWDMEKLGDFFKNVLEDGKGWTDRLTCRGKKGNILPVEISASVIETEGKSFILALVRDITKRKLAENKLITAKEEAEAATKLKDKFVSLASHDLRSPLSSITGFLNFIKSDTKNPLCPGHKEIVDRMIQTVGHQLNMIDGLLDLTRLQTGNILLELRFVNANMIGENIFQNMLSMAQTKGIKLINDIPDNTRLYADMTLYSEVIGNLVSNAIKFCDKGDTVRLFTPDNKKSIVAVSDTGVGIDSEIILRLFTQEDKTSTIGTAGEKGAGLGLPYSYEIMQAHKGKLYVESQIGAGAVFYAELPHVKPRILIVDDDEKVRGIIKTYVDPLETCVKEAVNGSEAIEVLEQFIPHLIITDISMPVLDGLQLLEHIRSNPAIKSVPVIIMTGTDINLREKAFQMQANDFITKPLLADEFIPRIRRFIG